MVGVDGRDKALADLVSRGDESALETLLAEHGGAVRSVARRVLHDATLAEDVVQDTFFRFWDAPERFDAGRGSLRTFLVTIAHRRAVDVVRSEVARSRRELKPPDRDHSDVVDEVWALTISETVRTALSNLPDGEREAISLAYLEGLSYVEVARRLGAPEGTVKSRIRTGMKRLAVLMSDLAPG